MSGTWKHDQFATLDKRDKGRGRQVRSSFAMMDISLVHEMNFIF